MVLLSIIFVFIIIIVSFRQWLVQLIGPMNEPGNHCSYFCPHDSSTVECVDVHAARRLFLSSVGVLCLHYTSLCVINVCVCYNFCNHIHLCCNWKKNTWVHQAFLPLSDFLTGESLLMRRLATTKSLTLSTQNIISCCRECFVFTAGFDAEQNVLVGVQVVVEDEDHRELCKDEAELKKRREEGIESN